MRQIQIKITLQNSNPAIWRRFLITDDYRLDRLHQVIQIIMGWWNSHLHEFKIGGRTFGMLFDLEDDLPDLEDETKFYLKNFPLKIGDQISYLYDFGDRWLHILEVENIIEGDSLSISCLEGEGRCPNEDSGGIYHYIGMLEAQFDSEHPEHRRFLGDNDIEDLPDPSFFDLKAVNKELRKFSKWHSQHPRMKSTPWHNLQ